jgi:hypothetical protein
MECKLDRVLELAGSGVILGRIVLFHLDDELLDANGHVDPLKLRPLGRLGGQNYASIGELLQIDAEGKTETSWSAKLDLWTELRGRSIAMVRQLGLSHLARVGGILRHLAACTHYRVLEWDGFVLGRRAHRRRARRGPRPVPGAQPHRAARRDLEDRPHDPARGVASGPDRAPAARRVRGIGTLARAMTSG